MAIPYLENLTAPLTEEIPPQAPVKVTPNLTGLTIPPATTPARKSYNAQPVLTNLTTNPHPQQLPEEDLYKEERDRFRIWFYNNGTKATNDPVAFAHEVKRAYEKSTPTPLPEDEFYNTLETELRKQKTFDKVDEYVWKTQKNIHTSLYNKAGEFVTDTVPWVAAAAAVPTIGLPIAASAFVLFEGAKKIVDRYKYGEETQPLEGLNRAFSGPGGWIDPRAESEMPWHAIIARDTLDSMGWFLGFQKGVVKGLAKMGGRPVLKGAQSLGAAVNNYPVIKAGLLEAQTWAKKPEKWMTQHITDPLWEKAVQAVNAKILPNIAGLTNEKMYTHGRLESVKVRKSIAEIMQPAVERLKPKLQDAFRDTTVLKSHLSNWGQELGGILARETNPLIRIEVAKGIRGTPISELTTERAKEIVSQYSSKLSDLKMQPRHENSFREAIGESIGKRLEAPENVYLGHEFTDLLDPIVKKVGLAKVQKYWDLFIPKTVGVGGFKFNVRAQNKVEVMQKGLKDLIEDPSVPYEFQIAAKDLFNLPSTLPDEVYKAASSLTHSMLTANLKNMNGVVLADKPEIVLSSLRSLLLEGKISKNKRAEILNKISEIQKNEYLPSTWEPFIKNGKSLYVLRDAELELKAMQTIPELANAAYSKYFMTPWKISKVMLRPAAILRNGFTNEMLNHMGGLPFWRQDIYYNAYKGMRGSQDKVLGKALNAHLKDFSKIAGSPGTFNLNELAQAKQLRFGASPAEKGLHWFNQTTSPAVSFYSTQETYAKFAKYLHNLEKGMGEKEAAVDAMKWTFNYGEVTRATARMRTYVAPFFTWQSKIFPLFAESVINNPIKWTGVILAYQGVQNAAIQAAGLSEGEWQDFQTKLPDYLKNGMMFPLPYRDSQGRLNMLDLTYLVPGFGDAYQLSGHPWSGFFQHPILSIGGGLQNNRKFSGAPIYYDWEDPSTRLAKQLAYVWEQLVPAPAPGGTDWNKMYQAFVQTPRSEFEPIVNDLSRTQALSSFLGGKITPLDIGTTLQQADASRRAKQSEVSSSLKRLLRTARTQKERDELMWKYLQYSQEVDQGEE